MSFGNNRTIIVTEGVGFKTARWGLKTKFEAYGEIEAFHMGNREDPVNHPPWVRFKKQEQAERLLSAMERGEVENLGLSLRGKWKPDDKPYVTDGDFTSWSRPDLDLTARDIWKMDVERQRRRKEKKRKKKELKEQGKQAPSSSVSETRGTNGAVPGSATVSEGNGQISTERRSKWEEDHQKNMISMEYELAYEDDNFIARGAGALEERQRKRKEDIEARRARGETVSSSPESLRSCHTPPPKRSPRRDEEKGKGKGKGKWKDKDKAKRERSRSRDRRRSRSRTRSRSRDRKRGDSRDRRRRSRSRRR